jgi:hypothetical protein
MAVELQRGIACAGRRGRGGKGPGEAPYRNVEILGHLLNSEKWWSGGGGLAWLGFARRGRRQRDEGIEGVGLRLYRGGQEGLDVRAKGAAWVEAASCRGCVTVHVSVR